MALILAKANSGTLAESVPQLRALAQRFADVPAVWNALGAALGQLGWKPEQAAVTLELGRRFTDPAALAGAARVYEQRGETETARALVQRVAELDAGSEILLERALRRRDRCPARTRGPMRQCADRAPPARSGAPPPRPRRTRSGTLPR